MDMAMELLEEFETSYLDKDKLKKTLTIKNLPILCESIDTVLSNEINEGVIYCVWGLHNIKREILEGGVQFSFQDCPHALTFSTTTNNDGSKIVTTCTTVTDIQDEDFKESIKTFIDDWMTGIKKQLNMHY